MNIACLTGLSRTAGGLYYAVSSLCRGLVQQGIQVSVFGRNDPFVTEDQHVWNSTATVAYKGLGPTGFSVGLRRDLMENHVDLIHQHGIWMDDQWAALQWQKKTGRPVVISPHGMLDPWAVQNSAWKKKLVGKLFANESLKTATCIHALSRSEVESIRAYGLKNPVALIPNGVELPEIDRLETEAGGRKQLLFFGRIHPKKGLEELLAGWAKSQRLKSGIFSEWQLLIAGWDDGDHEQRLKARVAELGITDTVSFIGAHYGEEKERLLQSVDAFILPSLSEGLPMSVLEAWSYRLPVVMTDFCNLPEGFEARAAIWIEPNEESISHGLEQLAALPETELRALGSNGRKLVEGKFTWPRIADNMHRIYEWCLTGGNPPDCLEF